MQLSPFLSLCRSIDRSHASSLWKQRWLFAIVATMRADIGFREKERPFRGRRGRKALRELYVPLIATRRCRRRRRRLPPPPLNESRQVRANLDPDDPVYFVNETGDWPNFVMLSGKQETLLSLFPSSFFPLFPLFSFFSSLFFFTLLSPSLLFIPIRSCLFFRISLACFLGCARVGELKLFTTRVEEERAVEEKMGRRVIPRGRYSGNKWGRGVEKERSKGCFKRGKKAEDVATQIPR